MTQNYLHMSPFLTADNAHNMLRIAESFGSFGTYADEASSEGLGEELPQRFDAALNYVQAGIDGSGNTDTRDIALQRTNYFRETYAYGNDIKAPGIEPFMEHPSLKKTARRISGHDIIVPAIVYANLLVPGQELAIHTDVPEFRGANRKVLPQWLLVVMLHSGLFDEWRIPISTCVSWFGSAKGGDFTFYPDGRSDGRQSIPAIHNSAIILDTDSVFHGVERVTAIRPQMPGINQQTRLHFQGDSAWNLQNKGKVIAEYQWPDLRYSISWKAYCFKDEAQQSLWREGGDDLSLEFILERLETELRRRGILQGERPAPTDYALMMVATFIQFPRAQ